MKTLINRMWTEDSGVLSFEWVLLISVLIVGIVGGLSAVRDAIIDELGDVAGAAVAIDQSYTVIACECANDDVDECFQVTANSFGFQDSLPECEGEPTPQRLRGTNPGQDANAGCGQAAEAPPVNP